METKFKDVAHLYLGVEVVNTIGKHMGKIVSVSIDGTATINPLDEFKPRVIILNSLKPILRPLSDMSNDEIWKLNEITKAGSWNLEMIKNIKSIFNSIHATPIVFHELIKLNFDLFGLIESGEALDKTKMNL